MTQGVADRRRAQVASVRDAILAMRAGQGDATVQERRAAWNARAAALPQDPLLEVTTADFGGVPCEVLRQRDQPTPSLTLLHLHGGGYVSGSPLTHRAGVARLARRLAARAVVPDYRLAPEHAFPAALDDALAVYRTLLDQGTDPARLLVVGDSAGGGLAVAMLVAAHQARLPMPAAMAVLAPWADLTLTAQSVDRLASVDFLLSRKDLEEGAIAYAGDQRRDPRASPVFADLAGLPPLLIQVGGADLLLDDAIALAHAAAAAGVAATLEVWPDMPHAWHAFVGIVDEAATAGERLTTWLLARLSGDDAPA